MSIPDWWSFLLLGIAAWRTFQLVAEDSLLDWPRRRLLRLAKEWEKEGDNPGDDYRMKWGLFLTCPYCAGFWISVAWYAAWQIDEFWTEFAAAGFGLNALVIAGSKTLAPSEEK